MNEHINLKLNDEQVAFLEQIAVEQKLYKPNKSPSTAKAMKYILDEKMAGNTGENTKDNDKILQLLEQIHVAIPHIMYHTRYTLRYCNAALKSSNVSEESIDKFKENAINDTVSICGEYQKYAYHSLFLSYDNKKMQTIPIEGDKNKWK